MTSTVDHVDVDDRVNDDAGRSGRYLFVTPMAAAIAMLDCCCRPPVVVMGAMLMGPIMGLGFALATLDSHHIRRALRSPPAAPSTCCSAPRWCRCRRSRT